MKKSNTLTKRVVVGKSESKANAKDGTVASSNSSKNEDNNKDYQCVLCGEKFEQHNLMIEHFR